MQALPGLFLFSVFVTTGVSLECESCITLARNCTGNRITCGPRQNACIISFVENALMRPIMDLFYPFFLIPESFKRAKVHSRKVCTDESVPETASQVFDGTLRTVEKGCEVFPICKFGDIYMNLGQNRTLRASSFCCKGDACQKVSLKLPPIYTTPNGKQCPACFSMKRHCTNETVTCIGPESHCFVADIDASFGPEGIIKIKADVKGCATESFCDIFLAGGKSYRGLGFQVILHQCKTASHGRVPAGFPLPFLALSGLLLIKVLP